MNAFTYKLYKYIHVCIALAEAYKETPPGMGDTFYQRDGELSERIRNHY